MKKSLKTMSTWLFMMAVAIFALTFTACGDDDAPVVEVTYTYGFSKISASHPDFISEMNKIEKAFKTALCITGTPFTKKGTIAECDEQVREACQQAFGSLKGDTWQGDYEFHVMNTQTGNTVYKATFSADDENYIF